MAAEAIAELGEQKRPIPTDAEVRAFLAPADLRTTQRRQVGSAEIEESENAAAVQFGTRDTKSGQFLRQSIFQK
jgi:hypothetical protein